MKPYSGNLFDQHNSRGFTKSRSRLLLHVSDGRLRNSPMLRDEGIGINARLVRVAWGRQYDSRCFVECLKTAADASTQKERYLYP